MWQQRLLAAKAKQAAAAAASTSSTTFQPPPRAAEDPEDVNSNLVREPASKLASSIGCNVRPSRCGPGGRRLIEAKPPGNPVSSFEKERGGAKVRIDIFANGDNKTLPKDYVEAHIVGRLSSGVTFESTRAKGRPPMRLVLGKGQILAGMELAIPELSLGTRAVIHVPAALGYGQRSIPKLIPANSDLSFEVEVLDVDGVKLEGPMPHAPVHASRLVTAEEYTLPWWLTRVARPLPNPYYVNFCRHMKRGKPGDIPGAIQLPRKEREDLQGWDLSHGGPFVFRGTQEDDLVLHEWSLDWIRQEFGKERALVKWIGPLFTNQEQLVDSPVWETSISEYIDYVNALEIVDPHCEEANAEYCPRLYLNGWPLFLQFPDYRRHVRFPNIDDVALAAVGEKKMMAEGIYQLLAGKSAEKPDDAEITRSIEEANWELVKLFVSPAGAITRLHYDNGGAHGWLSQVRGRKLFVCFSPDDSEHLHAFQGDEGQLSATYLDPLADDANERWPNFKKATPHVAILEAGETIFVPQGWWHYVVAMDTSVTVMRNFYSSSNKHEYLDRQEKQLLQATATALKNGKLKGQKTDAELEDMAQRLLTRIRGVVEKQTAVK